MSCTKIVVISGPSGAGKTTLLNSLIDVYPGSEPLVRVTTRTKRAADSAREYQYVSGIDFEEMLKREIIVNPVVRNGFSHGIPKDCLTKILPKGNMQFADLSPESAWLLANYLLQNQLPRMIVPFFLADCSMAILASRMRERGEQNIDLRLKEAENWQTEAVESSLGYTLINARKTKSEVLNQVVSALVS